MKAASPEAVFFYPEMMNTIRLTTVINPYEEWVSDILMLELAGAGFDTFVDTETGFEAYIPENIFKQSAIDQIKAEAPENYNIGFSTEVIPAQNWNEVWEKNYFKPLVISNQVVVRAPFHTEYPSCRYEIVIEPKMAFGTGNHETTSLVMETMLDMELTGKSLLDMGCGTGILAVLASMLGANPITAIDIDEWSYRATIENAGLNNTPNVTAFRGDASMLSNQKFEVILANIQKNIILADLHKYYQVLETGGLLLVSGFYKTDLEDIKLAAERIELVFENYREKNNWVAVLFSKK